jgi:(p)ppGpp synthase/HD superfamily hydrolase
VSGISVEEALAFAAEAHAGQVDKQGLPYILHPARVGASLWRFGEDYVIAGFLHDVVEDTPYSLEYLREIGFSDAVVSAVDSVTKTTSESDLEAYEASIRRAMGDPIGRWVKAADVSDNASRLDGISWGPVQARLRVKYEMAERVIGEYIDGFKIGSDMYPPVTRHLTGV